MLLAVHWRQAAAVDKHQSTAGNIFYGLPTYGRANIWKFESLGFHAWAFICGPGLPEQVRQ